MSTAYLFKVRYLKPTDNNGSRFRVTHLASSHAVTVPYKHSARNPMADAAATAARSIIGASHGTINEGRMEWVGDDSQATYYLLRL